ncbi:MAG: DUF3417 domain-containing protein [Geobacteraceae bacterium]|nr:DUF3417 domain-containing protein [Geobacteraceae bacterium]
MSTQTPPRHPLCTLLPAEVEGFDSLVELALDMRWSWNHATDEVWRSLDPELWDLTHHPCDVMQTVSRDKVRSMLADPVFRSKIDDLVQSKKQEDEAPAWFQEEHPQASLTENWEGKLIAVIVSGYDGDGAAALRGIKEVGGITIAQKPDTASQPDMPESAIASGHIDFILSPEDIAKEIVRIAQADLE